MKRYLEGTVLHRRSLSWALMMLGLIIIAWPPVTFTAVMIVFSVAVVLHTAFVIRQASSSGQRRTGVLVIVIDALIGTLVWLYPADDIVTLTFAMPVWVTCTGLIQVLSADRNKCGLYFGWLHTILGISIAVLPFLVCSLVGAATTVAGALLLIHSPSDSDRTERKSSDRHNFAMESARTMHLGSRGTR